MAASEVRRSDRSDGGAVVVERLSLGQVADYSVYVVKPDGDRTYVGGGSKREAMRLFARTVKS